MSTETDKPEVKTTEQTQEALQQEPEAAPEATRTVEVAVNPRWEVEARLAERSGKNRDAEARERIPGMEPAPAEEPAVETAPAEVKVEAPAEGPVVDTAAPVAVEAIDPNTEIDLIIDGKPTKVKASQILDVGKRAMQKELAADQRLQLATQLLDEATKRSQGQPSAQDAQPQERIEKTVQAKSDAELAKLLQYGSEDEAAHAIAEIRRRDTAVVTQDSLQEFIGKHLPAAVSAQLTFHQAVTEARRDYADIFANPDLTTLFHVKEHQARQAGDARPHAELYKALGDGIRATFKMKAPTPPAGPTLAEKQEAKAKAPSVPKLASVRIEQPGGGAPLSREEARKGILEEMSKQRAQGSLRKY